MTECVQRKLLISKGWIQAVVIVMLCGFLILGMLAYRTYTDEPPIPCRSSIRTDKSCSRERMCLLAKKCFSVTD